MAAPTFSIVIAAYDAEATVAAAVRSALAQTRSDLEVVVVDDGSVDDTVARVQAVGDDRVRLVRQENRGPGAARNAGIAVARGEYVSLLDSDDLLLPTFLEEMHQALRQASGDRFAYTDAWCFEQDRGRFRRTTAMARQRPPLGPLAPGAFLDQLARRNFVFNAVMVRRERLEAVGGYAPDLPRAQDYELWLRLAAAGCEGVRVPGPLGVYRLRSDSLSADRQAVRASLREVFERVLHQHPVPPAIKAVARERIAELDRATEIGAGRRPVASSLLRTRHLLGRARRRIDSPWLAEPPPAVAAAFPELCAQAAARDDRAA